ncbi:MAG: hypothetical protein D6761_06885 [Candidatus Dadabacteria bacterium]|nr:MAG: hypothetical protein D6761_06885 [Candidatus Dadabacteria bacterium]
MRTRTTSHNLLVGWGHLGKSYRLFGTHIGHVRWRVPRENITNGLYALSCLQDCYVDASGLLVFHTLEISSWGEEHSYGAIREANPHTFRGVGCNCADRARLEEKLRELWYGEPYSPFEPERRDIHAPQEQALDMARQVLTALHELEICPEALDRLARVEAAQRTDE